MSRLVKSPILDPPDTVSYDDVLANAGATLALMLEVKDPAELAIIRQHASPAMLGLAVLMLETDPEFAPRWATAGTDWMARGELLHEVLFYLLTPETSAKVALS